MKKTVLLLMLFSLMLHAQETIPAPTQEAIPLSAQEITPVPAPEEATPETEEYPSASYASMRVAQSSSDWQNWIFAGGAAVVFTVGVLIVTLNTGSAESGH